ncbi:MAG: helical backbone metal receptor [Planctomycetota bacterium]|jgi:iron complex transport system substrate-binding protein|nr:helical backbone metal receptor [Planctomycetota bacterium]
MGFLKKLRLLFACLAVAGAARAAGPRPHLISLAPSLTEIVFAIGAGDALVGVTDHCRYPPEALARPKIGGYQTPSLETIMALRPDLLLTLAEHAPIHAALDSLGLKYEVFDHRSLPGLLASFARLGEICSAAGKAGELERELAEAFRAPTDKNRVRPSLLVLLGRSYGQGGIANAYAIGKDRLYDRLIAAAGCRNAYQGDLAYPVLSTEGVAAMNPDIIAEITYAEMGSDLPAETLLRDWEGIPNLKAARNRRVFVIRADYALIPGPRLILFKRDLLDIVRRSGLAGAP